MRKLFYLLALFCTSLYYGQTNGITYQAVIYYPNGQNIPGQDIQNSPMTNKFVCLQFSLIDDLSQLEYQETIQTTTDEFGMVNLIIGSGTQVGGYAGSFNAVIWNSNLKTLKVELDPRGNCQDYIVLSDNPLSAVPFAYAALTANNVSGTVSILNGGTGANNLTDAKINLGLGNVDNTSDAAKPISTATQSALDAKEALSNKSTSATLGTSDVLFPTQNAVKTYVDNQVASATIPDADASTKGKIQLAGDLSGTAAAPTVPALATKENSANKSAVTTLGTSDVLFPTQNAVKTYVDTNISTVNANNTALQATVTANANAATTAIAAVQADVDANEATSIATDTALQNNINTLQNTVATNATNTAAALALKEDATNKSTITTLGTSDVLFPTQNAVKTYVDAQVASATIVDADANTKGKIQLAGDLSGTAAAPTVPALASKENTANKSAVTTLGTSDVLFPTQNAVKTYVDLNITSVNNANSALQATVTSNANAATTAIAAVQADVDANEATSTAADTALQNNITTLQNTVATNATNTAAAIALKEDAANKSAVTTLGTSDQLFPTQNAVKTYVDLNITSVNNANTALQATVTANANSASTAIAAVQADVDANETAVNNALALKEDAANKSTATTLGTSDQLFPTQNAVKTYVDAQVASATIADADATTKGKIQLTGDLGGTAGSPSVPGLALKENAANKTLDLSTVDGTSDIKFPSAKATKDYVDAQIATGVVDASTSIKGKVRLAGDLIGTADLPRIANDAVTTTKILDANVTPAKLEAGSNNTVLVTDGSGVVAWLDANAFGAVADMTTIEGAGTTASPFVVKDLGIVTAKLANGAVTSAKILDGTILVDDLADDAVETAKIKNGNVTTAKLADDAVTTVKITNANVTTSKLADDAVTTTKILDANVTPAKLEAGSNNTVLVTDGSGVVAWLDANAFGAVADMTTIEGAGTTASPFVVKDLGIVTAKLANGAVTTAKLDDDAVTTAKILDGTILVDDLANDAVETAKIKNGNVTTAKLADDAVTTVKITNANITTAKLADDAVTTVKITNANVTSSKLADDAVTTAKILDANVTPAKLEAGSNNTVLVTDGSGVVAWLDANAFGAVADMTTIEGAGTTASPFVVKDLGIVTAKLANGAVTSAKLADDAVTTAKILDGTILVDDLANDAVETAKIKNGNVTTAKLADDAVTTVKILDGTILVDDIADDAVETAKIKNENVTTSKLADNAVTTVKITNANVTTAKLADDAVTTTKILDANVTPAKLEAGSNNTVLVTDGSGVVAWLDANAFGAVADMTTIEGAGTTASPFVVKDLGIVTAKLANGAVTSAKLDDDAVTTAKILDGTILVDDLADDAVETAKIKNGNVTTAKLADDAVTTAKILDGTILVDDLANDAVETAKIKNANVTTAKLADDAVTTVKITNANVTTAKLADDAVTTTKILDANVTPAKLEAGSNNTVLVTDGSGVVAWLDANAFGAVADMTTIEGAGTTASPFVVKDLGIVTAKLANGAVTTAKLADDAVTTAKILDGTILVDDLADDAVETAKIKNANVTTAKLADDAVTTAKILDGTILVDDLADDAVETAKIKNANVTTAKLADDAVTTAKILDGTIIVDDLADDAVETAKIKNANVTYAKIQNVSATDKVLGRVSSGAGVIEEIATTGSGDVVRATSPSLVTPNLGTPSAVVLTNATGLPLTSGAGVIGILPEANGGTGSATKNFVDLTSSQTVAGAKTFSGNTAVSGTSTFTVGTGATVLGGTLGVTGNTTIGGTTTLNGNTSVSGTNTLTVGTGATTLGGTLAVTGATTLSSTLSAGASTLSSATITNNATVGGTFGVTGATTLSSTLGVTGNTTIGGTTTLNGNTSVSGSNTLTVGTGATTLGGTLAVTGATTLSSTLGVTGDVAVNTDKFKITASSGNTEIAGTIKIAGGSPSAGKVLVSDANGLASWSSNSNGGASLISASATMAATDTYNLIVFSGSTAAQTITLPSASSAGAGREITIKNIASVSVRVNASGGSLISDSTTTGATELNIGIEPSNNWIKAISTGTNWIILRGLF